VLLRLLTGKDCNETYLNWLLDPEINQFLETRWRKQTLESITEFVESLWLDPDNYLFAIIEAETKKHIGNIKLGPINRNHLYADISYFIGERSAWCRGYASEAIQLVTQFAFAQLKLHRVQAGLYANNIGSAKALEKAGYHFEAVFRKQLRFDSRWEDH